MVPDSSKPTRRRFLIPKLLAVTIIACGAPPSPKDAGADSGLMVDAGGDGGQPLLPDGGLDCSGCTAGCEDGLCEPESDGDGGEYCQCLS